MSKNLTATIKIPTNIGSGNSMSDNSTIGNNSTIGTSNIMKYMIYIGMGVCIIVLILMASKIVSDGNSIGNNIGNMFNSAEDKLKKLGGSNTDSNTDSKKGDTDNNISDNDSDNMGNDNNNMRILPGLFNKPIIIFEKGDEKKIKSIKEEIYKLNQELIKSDNETPCSEYNNKILNMSLDDNDKWKENYDNYINKCSNSDVCDVDNTQILKGKCTGSKSCTNNFYKNYKNTNEEIDSGFIDKYCPSSSNCSYTPQEDGTLNVPMSETISDNFMENSDSLLNSDDPETFKKSRNKYIGSVFDKPTKNTTSTPISISGKCSLNKGWDNYITTTGKSISSLKPTLSKECSNFKTEESCVSKMPSNLGMAPKPIPTKSGGGTLNLCNWTPSSTSPPSIGSSIEDSIMNFTKNNTNTTPGNNNTSTTPKDSTPSSMDELSDRLSSFKDSLTGDKNSMKSSKSSRKICVNNKEKLKNKIDDLNNELNKLVGYSISLG